jgi:hypothetical protein
MTVTTLTNRDDFVAHIVSRAWKDESYRKRLLANSKAVLAEELGLEIPERVEVRVLEEEQNVRYLVIPYTRDKFHQPVTDAELASASGPVMGPTNTSTAITSPCDCG